MNKTLKYSEKLFVHKIEMHLYIPGNQFSSFDQCVLIIFIFYPGGIYLDLDSLALNSFDPLRNYSTVQGAPYPYSLANGVIIGAQNNLFHWLFYLSYYNYKPDEFVGNSVMMGMRIAMKYPNFVHVDYNYILRPNIAERYYLFRDGWLWNWSLHYCVHIYARYVRLPVW